MPNANHKVRERCLICEGLGRAGAAPCAYCSGSGYVFAVSGAPKEVLLATGDCKVPARRKPAFGTAQGSGAERKYS